MWNMLKGVKKFTPKSELDKIIGTPLFQLENRPVYYYGNGIAVYFSSQCFRVEGIQRVEYGALGEYAVGIYHFSDVTALKTGLGLNVFGADDVVPLKDDIINGAISYHSTYNEVWRWVQKNPSDYQTEGVTQELVNGKMAFKYSFITYGQFEFFFYGKSKRTKLTGFQYVFNEERVCTI